MTSPNSRTRTRIAIVAMLLLPASLLAQQGPVRRLTLDDAVRTAEAQSEAITIARAGVTRSNGQQYQARSAYLPQLAGSAAYTKTLKSQFSALAGGGGADTNTVPAPVSLCAPRIASNASAAERAAAIAQASTCAQAQSIDFSKVGFGAKNQWVLGLQASQNVFTFGRIEGQLAAANAARSSADIELRAQRAQLVLDVTQAYFDAALASRLTEIADTSLAQAEEILRQTKAARAVGSQSEFELLRAQVTRDNQLPVRISAYANRDIAVLRLKQLLNLPLDDRLELATSIDEPSAPAFPAGFNASSDTSASSRAVVRQAEQNVRAQEGLARVARSQRYPAIALTSSYQRLFFPQNTFPTLSQFSENWTVGFSMGAPLFTGGRLHGDEMVAQANVLEARARLQQATEYAALDARLAATQLQQAEASWNASAGTAAQARKAYEIDQIRFREGISTQTDLAQSRLLLEQSLANRAQAARDLAVARARLALLADLPLPTSQQSTPRTQGAAGQAGGATR